MYLLLMAKIHSLFLLDLVKVTPRTSVILQGKINVRAMFQLPKIRFIGDLQTRTRRKKFISAEILPVPKKKNPF